jgi:hypothetical protein
MWALLGNGSNSVVPLQQERPIVGFRSNTSQCWIEDKRQPLDKVFSYQTGKMYLTGTVKGADQRNRSETQRQEQIKGADQRRNVRVSQRNRSETQRQSRSKEPIRDATSGGDQRSRSETQRQEEIKGADQRRNVRVGQRNRSETQRQEQIKGVRLEQQPRSQQSKAQPR